ncbi:S-DNA-T family DNA segregation ATPase FtsK/SpoIIIE [Nocardia transvalensis]|uniref:S-DNA-T family DNA segregation ATPase FtsK/SpoIIIE n=1 Tax=Nocardia transvalensis TaxID=37333 RepID=A0A7W9UMV0_9NOCA|nr:type VII secretion protein EccCa [Nocardia transvalensis]MBB5918752.1 S-DNA-T family DNA segregation ATPase FtsK/SpoIIIE [Nocardia transvalensis]
MSITRRFVRPARTVRGPKAPAVTELRLQPPTELPKPVPPSRLKMIMPVVMVAAMAGMMVMMFRNGGQMSPMMMFFPLMMLGSMFGMMGGSLGGGGSNAASLNEERKDYLRSLADNRKSVHTAETELHAYLRYTHPGPNALSALVGTTRMWEVQVAAPQFLRVRVGRGRIANQVRVIVPEAAPTSDLDPVGVVELTRFAKAYSTVGGMPVAINLLSAPLVGLDGDEDEVGALIRAMLAEVIVTHGPDQVAIAAVLSDPDAPKWSWLKWLPHTQHATDTDAIGSSRMVYRSVAELRAKVLVGLNRGPFSANSEPSADRKHFLLIVDMGSAISERDISGIDGCTWLRLGPMEQALPRSLRFTVDPEGTLFEVNSRGSRKVGIADGMSVPAVTALARAVSPYRLSTVVEAVVAEQASGGTSWEEMVDIPDPGAVRIERQWVRRRDTDRARLNIPFGHDPAGGLVYLDIKESAEEGMGPHGMCIGATGSGKSEFLRTLVLSAIATHSPDALNLLLVDFKGGATFLGFDRLHHVTAVVTNMEEEADLVTRMEDVLNGEMARRQRILRDAGNFASVADYERAREQGARLPPLPTLLVILDEFAELLEQYPSFAKLFVAIGRLGRSLRIHLLLASQKVPANRMGELEAHLSYRVALRTNQTADSRDAIGTADAYHLPKKPGSGYLRVGAGDLQRFQAAYVGSPYIPPAQTAAASVHRARRAGGGYRPPQQFTATHIVDARPEPVEQEPLVVEDVKDGEPVTLMETVLQQFAGTGRPAHKMWLPPLNVPPALERLVAAVQPGTLEIPLAIVDKPRQQAQDVWSVDLSGAGGHMAVVGGPQSGKSTVLQTLMMSAALTHTPEQVQFYCLDFSGGLSSVRKLAHVGSVAQSREVDRLRRTFALITNLLASRQMLFTELEIDSMREFRRRRSVPEESAQITARGDIHGDVFVVIDGWDIGFSVNGPYYDEYMPAMESLAVQGLNYGIHLVISSSRWAAVRPAVKDMVQTRVEMRLGDLSDTVFPGHRSVVASIPPDRPGRCISGDGLHMLTALPRIDGVGDAGSAAAGLAAAITDVNARYQGREAPPVRLLPDRITLAEVRAGRPEPVTLAQRLAVPFGIRESDLSPATVDFGISTHFAVLGSSGCGKSTVLATLLESIRTRFTADQARVLLIDYRRQHMEAIPTEQQVGYLTSERDLVEALPVFARKMRERRPPDNVTPQQLKERSWWSGPEIFVVVDDYHMVVPRGAMNPLDSLKDLIVDGRDTGFHFIAARNIAQADMALYDSVLGQVKNLNCSGLIMDGTKMDGMLIGDVKPMKQPVGRGILVEPLQSRRDLVQSAWSPEQT